MEILLDTVEEYLNLFSSKDDFTTDDAFRAMLYHYLEVKMVDLYLNFYPTELIILSYDELDVSITTNSLNYLQVNFERRFRFNNDEFDCDENQIRLELHFENISNDSNYYNHFKFSITESDEFFNNQINSLKNDVIYNKVKNTKPSKYDLYFYNDF